MIALLSCSGGHLRTQFVGYPTLNVVLDSSAIEFIVYPRKER